MSVNPTESLTTVASEIPRQFHRVWVGTAPIPDEFEEYGRTWLLHHPRWDMRTWTEDLLPPSIRPEALDRLRHPVERSDILRLELLRLYGGVYVDMDFECLRSIEALIDGLDFFVGESRPGRVTNAIIGSVPGHPILERAVRELRPRAEYGFDKHAAGAHFLRKLLDNYPEAHRFEPGYFYQSASRSAFRATPDQRSEVYAVHHEARSWKTHEQMNSQINDLRDQLREVREQLAAAERKKKQTQDKAKRKVEKAEAQRDRALKRAGIAEARVWRRVKRKLTRVSARLPRIVKRGSCDA
jgi:inositol phosphorylceramide mannosyltransferase catalytic subunit